MKSGRVDRQSSYRHSAGRTAWAAEHVDQVNRRDITDELDTRINLSDFSGL